MEEENPSGVWKAQLLLGEGEDLAMPWLLRALGHSCCWGAEAAGSSLAVRGGTGSWGWGEVPDRGEGAWPQLLLWGY